MHICVLYCAVCKCLTIPYHVGQIAVKQHGSEAVLWAHCAAPRLVIELAFHEWNSKILLTLTVAKHLPVVVDNIIKNFVFCPKILLHAAISRNPTTRKFLLHTVCRKTRYFWRCSFWRTSPPRSPTVALCRLISLSSLYKGNDESQLLCIRVKCHLGIL